MNTILFDLDGTLVDSEPLSRIAWEQLLAVHGHTLSDVVYGSMVGNPTRESAVIVREHYGLPAEASAIHAEKDAIWEKIWLEGVPAMPGLFALLDELRERDIPWGVVTSSTRRYAAHVLKKLGIDGECRALVGGDEIRRNKPYPDAYLLGAERIGADVACCWVVEDSTPGMQAGLNAGMRVLAIPGPLVVQEFIPEGVQVIDSLAEVLPAIDGK